MHLVPVSSKDACGEVLEQRRERVDIRYQRMQPLEGQRAGSLRRPPQQLDAPAKQVQGGEALSDRERLPRSDLLRIEQARREVDRTEPRRIERVPRASPGTKHQKVRGTRREQLRGGEHRLAERPI